MVSKDLRAELKSQFPPLGDLVYANHASLAPWPRDTMQAVQRYARLSHESGPLVYRQWLETAQSLRELCARMLNAASAEDIALLKNTTEGIDLIANGIDWRKGDNIVTTAQEFISNRLPWEMLSSSGVELRRIDVHSSPDPEAELLNTMDQRTRLLSVSSVQWSDGFRLDLNILGAACRPAGVLFFVDAIQHFGALQLDVRADQVDAMSAGSHKWQMGPEGMGVFYCGPELRERLALKQFGWHMLKRRFQFDTPGREPDSSGRRYEAGTPNRLGQVALLASLSLLDRIGPGRVERAVLSNTERLICGIQAIHGVSVTSAIETPRRSGIVSLSCAHSPAGEFVRLLRETGVAAIQRGDAVRLSPHFYQQGEQIEAILDRIEMAVSRAR